jgi:predicted nucleic acid-binding protein
MTKKETLFADTYYWVAILKPNDQYKDIVSEKQKEIQENECRIITSELVLCEVCNTLSKHNILPKEVIADFLSDLKHYSNMTVVSFNDINFDEVLGLFGKYSDKDWSFVDHSSILISKEFEISYILSGDKHFAQAGLTPIF